MSKVKWHKTFLKQERNPTPKIKDELSKIIELIKYVDGIMCKSFAKRVIPKKVTYLVQVKKLNTWLIWYLDTQINSTVSLYLKADLEQTAKDIIKNTNKVIINSETYTIIHE